MILLKRFIIFFCFFSITSHSMAQESYLKQFRKLNFPVKWWVITHPFVVKKAFRISNFARTKANELKNDSVLDGDYAGGQVDAFRHTYWMTLLTQEIGSRKALKLGKSYERGNKTDFSKKIFEDNYLPDYMSCKMDLLNNEIGIKIGRQNINASKIELKSIVIEAILEGKMFIIKKNKEGKFLSETNRVIPDEEHLGKWHSPKTLVPSNYIRP